jgi:hypothetical protein
MVQKMAKFFLVIVILLVAFSPPASAYLDPGFGSMVWQMLAAAAFGLAFTIKIYWIKIKNFFSGKKPEQDHEEQEYN